MEAFDTFQDFCQEDIFTYSPVEHFTAVLGDCSTRLSPSENFQTFDLGSS
jgi:hypothetical protein